MEHKQRFLFLCANWCDSLGGRGGGGEGKVGGGGGGGEGNEGAITGPFLPG